jgi:hypothetical protein
MANALRSMKVAVEGLLGQTEETGSTPQVYASAVAPRQNIGVTLDVGDIWVDTANKKTLWWDGNEWVEFGAKVSSDQIDEIANQVSGEFVESANQVLATSINARDLALQAQTDAEAASAEAAAYRLQAQAARDAALGYRGEAQAARDAASISAVQAEDAATSAAAAEAGAAATVSQAVTDASAARDAAQAAKTTAEQAAASALASKNVAESASNSAVTAASSAGGSATAAAASASTAATSATSAGQSATAAAASLTQAQTAASSASTSATQAATSATNAAGSASSAATSATTASNSATQAGTSASAAATSATTAATKATEAAQSASASQTSATAAATSASNASTSASQAATSETNAAGSAASAATSATTAAQSVTQAGNSATSAATSASTATTKATEAAQSASAAQTSAVNAANSASGASGSATAAAASAQTAQTSATQAGNSATAAQTSAVDAATSAGQANTSATAAATSATAAATKATEASQSAAASQTSATNAATSSGAASTSATQAANSASGAAGSASAAAASQALAATISSRGVSVITDQFLTTNNANNWQRWQTGGTLTLATNEVYPLGQSWDFNITATSQRAGLWTTTTATQWRGARNADAYFVEVEFTLVSGSLNGAGILFDWVNSGNTVFRSQKTLTEMLGGPATLNAVMVAGGVFVRPTNFTGTFSSNLVYAIANDTPFTTAVKRIKFHRVSIRVATAEEQAKGTIGTAFSLVDARLNNDFYTIAEADQAITSAVTTLQSTLLTEIAATNATLTDDYLTTTQTDAAISSATTTLKAQLEAPTGSIGLINASLINDYYTATQTDSAITSATTTLKSQLEDPTGSIGLINASLTTDYFTAAQTNAAITSATTTLKSQLEDPTGSIGLINANLANNYYTITSTNSAIAAESTTLKALLRDSFTPNDFAQDGTYWTQSINATPAAAANLGTPFTFVTVSTLGRSVRIAAPQAAAQIITPKEALSNIPGKSYRVTIRARHNNAFAGNSQTALRFGLRPLSTSYAGTTNLSLTPLTFTAANTNETFTFEVTTTGTTAFVRPFLEVLNTNFGTTGPTIEISMFEMVDSSAAASVQSNVTATLNTNHYTRVQTDSAISSSITTYNAQLTAPTGALGSLSANLTNNYYTKTAADTATAAQISTYDASVEGGVAASVTSHAVSIATLEGNAVASIGFRTQAGSAGALLELVSLANPGGAASTARIAANNIILDGTVTFNSFAAGGGGNLLQNTNFASGLLHWGTYQEGTAQTTFAVRNAGEPWAGTSYPTLMLFQNGTAANNNSVIYSGFWRNNSTQVHYGPAVTPGTWYEASVQVSTHRCKVDISVGFYDSAGNNISFTTVGTQTEVASSSSNPDSWPRIGGKVQAPANAAYMGLLVYKYGTLSGPNSYVFFHKPYVGVTHSAATALTPYSVGGSTIIDGATIKTGSITADSAVLGDAVITSAKIANLTVGTEKITGNAISVIRTVGAWSDYRYTVIFGWTTVASITFTPASAEGFLMAFVDGYTVATSGSQTNGYGQCQIRVLWRGTEIASENGAYAAAGTGGSGVVTKDANFFGFATYAGSGSGTLELQIYNPGRAAGYGTNIGCSLLMAVTEMKK